MTIRRSSLFFLFVALHVALLGLIAADAARKATAAIPHLAEKRSLAHKYGLTDLCLFTEARYTRHPVLADYHSALQDGPLSFEHFPSGTLVPPPPTLLGKGPHD